MIVTENLFINSSHITEGLNPNLANTYVNLQFFFFADFGYKPPGNLNYAIDKSTLRQTQGLILPLSSQRLNTPKSIKNRYSSQFQYKLE